MDTLERREVIGLIRKAIGVLMVPTMEEFNAGRDARAVVILKDLEAKLKAGLERPKGDS